MRLLWLLFISMAFLARPVSASAGTRSEMPEKIVYVYGQPLYDANISNVLARISQGKYSSMADTRLFSPGTSVWTYLPYPVLQTDTTRKFLVTGYQDRIDLFQKQKNGWKKIRSAGKYVIPEKGNEPQRAFVKLFDRFPADSSTAFLVVCRKQNNYCFSPLRADLVSRPELLAWLSAYKTSVETYSKITLPFFGISVTTIVLLLMKYLLSRDRAYALHGGGHTLFLLFFILLYYQYPVNIDDGPFKNPLIGIYLDKFFLFLSMSCLLLSIRFFYHSGRFVAFNNKVIGRLATASAILAVLTLILTQITGRYYMINNICMVSAAVIISLLGIHLVRIRSEITGAFQIIVLGLIFLIAFVFAGFGWVLLSYRQQEMGYEVQQAFPMLLGVGVSNLFIIAAFTKREHQIHEESIDLRAKAYEAEMSVVQKSLNPHFIFNCLNLIDSFLYVNNCSSARRVLFDFSDLLRLVIEKSPQRLIPLSEELRILQLYVELERFRSDQCIAFEVSIAPMLDINKLCVPPLLVQPIVENAIRHGILNKPNRNGSINLTIGFSYDNLLNIKIEDDGVGFGATKGPGLSEAGKRGHFGISLTQKRLEIMSDVYHVNARIDIAEKGAGQPGTVVNLLLPIIKI